MYGDLFECSIILLQIVISELAIIVIVTYVSHGVALLSVWWHAIMNFYLSLIVETKVKPLVLLIFTMLFNF